MCRQESKAQFSGAKRKIQFNCCLRNMHPPGNVRTLAFIIVCRTDLFFLVVFKRRRAIASRFTAEWDDRSVDLTPLKYVRKCLLQLQNVCISKSLFSAYSLFCFSLFTTLENPLSLGHCFSPVVTSCNGYLLKVLRHETLVGESFSLVVF